MLAGLRSTIFKPYLISTWIKSTIAVYNLLLTGQRLTILNSDLSFTSLRSTFLILNWYQPDWGQQYFIQNNRNCAWLKYRLLNLPKNIPHPILTLNNEPLETPALFTFNNHLITVHYRLSGFPFPHPKPKRRFWHLRQRSVWIRIRRQSPACGNRSSVRIAIWRSEKKQC